LGPIGLSARNGQCHKAVVASTLMDEDLTGIFGAFALLQSIIDHYHLLVGRLMSETAQVGSHFDSIMAFTAVGTYVTDAAIPPAIVDLTFTKKLKRVRTIAEENATVEPETLAALAAPADKVAAMRNLVAHASVVTGDLEPYRVAVRHSPRRTGYTQQEIILGDLEASIEQAKDLTFHAMLLWTHLPENPRPPMYLADVED